MLPHHRDAIQAFLARYEEKAEFIGILLAGSLAHGYAQEHSDIDIILIADEAAFRKHAVDNKLAFSIKDVCRYPQGYVDCKVVSLASLKDIAERGSDAARFAFKDARILRSSAPSLPSLIEAVCRFPIEAIEERQHRFASQLLAWKWYLRQAEEKGSSYLRHLACQKVALFSCRLILNRNQRLFPYHKWLLQETKRAEAQPPGFQDQLAAFLENPTFDQAQVITDQLLAFLGNTESEIDWPNQFMTDSELNWKDAPPPIDDL
ncbi:nucleotidyltransferase domain-containing protein [Pelagicoccus sp. SDUM812003]|uniref:nucleotidyltransferase domain-containing protein n=1 Tax=Pelagicoccus sp. SDUM812003 TaxID=3041267 RepID=UPI00280CBF81|nr:nucleotidyltransferase domain-containing protein [Pelagicoccus sp. SDUM812003]MDQ8205380.1 nucleotidyltransferase domain-containing protein [Pelagicoccus sp. SDUM812003]